MFFAIRLGTGSLVRQKSPARNTLVNLTSWFFFPSSWLEGSRAICPDLLCSQVTYRARACNSKGKVQDRFGILRWNEVTWGKANSPEQKHFTEIYWLLQLSLKTPKQNEKKKSQTNRFPSTGLMIFWEAWISKVCSCATWSTKGWYSWLSRLLTWWLMTMFYPLWLACGFQSIFFCTGEHGSPKRHILTKSFGDMMFRTVLPLELLLLKPQLQLLEALSLRDI